ncbi:hypothetical protein DC20_05835 [Rufibacter tibetensis]|uniref:Uncharacterized protein n=1 Tax=Rufibacter tibetensis TaxID=512763 RepID=A0A0P0CTM6_9BACT|nr:hypothetical protein DC20_05835 [Rufibacter tibetensis]
MGYKRESNSSALPPELESIQVVHKAALQGVAGRGAEDYKELLQCRLDLFRYLHSQNPEVPELIIFQKTQKLLSFSLGLYKQKLF